ncbi:sialidase family protein [Paenibacillus sp. FSL R10-2734]|uniref:sialidase family protein n=1 Tax=Paenibacillus sp. FSL R10-2734 TaxID=2954691 RepID=UPI0030DA565E
MQLTDRYDGILRQSEQDSQLTEALLPIRYEPDSHSANMLELDNGDLLCVWFSGSGEGNPDTNVLLSRLPAGSNRWEEPIEVASDLERSEQNPVVFQAPDGGIWLLHTSTEPHNQRTSRIIFRISEDRGRTWGERCVLHEGPGLFLRSPILAMSNGEWLLPCYYCKDGGHYSVVLISSDQGATWKEYEVEGAQHRVQMSVVERHPGTLFAVFRSRQADRIYSSTSTDFGRTWSQPIKTALPNNNSSVQMTQLTNGDLVLIYNDSTMERDQHRWVQRKGEWRKKPLRTPLTIAVSEDGGATWPYIRNIQISDAEYREFQIGYSYPCIIQTKDGIIHTAYSFLRKAIKYVQFTEDWIKGRKDASLVVLEEEDLL